MQAVRNGIFGALALCVSFATAHAQEAQGSKPPATTPQAQGAAQAREGDIHAEAEQQTDRPQPSPSRSS
jgi:hypothetical protein